MDSTLNCALAAPLARELRASRDDLTRRWLDRIADRVSLEPNRIFPSDELLDHVPVLVEGIAGYVEDPADEITADVPVIAKALELGELRHAQGFDAHEILKEYEILGGVLFSFLVRVVDRIPEPCTRGELLTCAHRLFRAIAVIQQVTTSQYLMLARQRVREREERLRGFNRTVSHEMKNRIAAVLGSAQMLGEEWVQGDPEKLQRFVSIVMANAEAMQAVLEDLLTLSRTDGDARQQRNVLLPDAVAEVIRQLRQAAQEQGVALRVARDLPEVEVNASAVELCLSNYISNAIKYSDPTAPERWVEITGELRGVPTGQELVVRVLDNGIGVPPALRGQLFERFFRADNAAERGIEGTGLGLSIVRETVESLGGRVWAELDGERGSAFLLAVPVRREGEVD
jgi:signal transduction histidine kinase